MCLPENKSLVTKDLSSCDTRIAEDHAAIKPLVAELGQSVARRSAGLSIRLAAEL